MPVAIFNLAAGLANLPEKEATLKVAHARLADHPNAFVRRVFYCMLRFMEPQALPEMKAVVLRALDDPAAWVVYDAAWAVEVQNLYTPAIVEKLRMLADGFVGDETITASDAAANVKKRAAKTMRALPVA